MTMLTHRGGRFEPATGSSPARSRPAGGAAHLAMIRRFCVGTLALLAIAGSATAVVALKTAIFFWRYPL